MIAAGVLIASVTFFTAVDAARSLSSVVDPAVRRRWQLHVVATLLRGMGLLGLFVTQAIAFRDWKTYFLPFIPMPGVPRSRRTFRRMDRQIEGREEYRPEDVPQLRELARRRLAGAASVLSTACLIVFSLGVALSPLTLTPLTEDAPSGVDRAFQVLGVILLVVLTPGLVTVGRYRRAAQQFLERTSPEETTRAQI